MQLSAIAQHSHRFCAPHSEAFGSRLLFKKLGRTGFAAAQKSKALCADFIFRIGVENGV
jgi:hypothetical protein